MRPIPAPSRPAALPLMVAVGCEGLGYIYVRMCDGDDSELSDLELRECLENVLIRRQRITV